GESCALAIATRLGLPAPLIQRANQLAYQSHRHTNTVVPVAPAATMSTRLPGYASHQRLVRAKPGGKKQQIPFTIGDSCMLLPEQQIAIVYAVADERGMVGVQVQGRKILVNHKRLRLRVAATDLYPEDYDMSIVFDTPQVRKARKLMTKRHQKGNVINLLANPE
ncbi:MAG: DNA mismatch repair protein MutS, partial [Symbiobacteriaceae bacterium]|nr:DNA mismatch repair protein MutS [Symbiobacteriaceae bacterium]